MTAEGMECRAPCPTLSTTKRASSQLDALRSTPLASLRRDELTALDVELGRLDDPLVKSGGTQGLAFRSLLPDFAELNDVVVGTAQLKASREMYGGRLRRRGGGGTHARSGSRVTRRVGARNFHPSAHPTSIRKSRVLAEGIQQHHDDGTVLNKGSHH